MGILCKIKRPASLATAVGLTLSLLLSLSFVSGCADQGVYTTSYFDSFDTVLTITVGAPDRGTAVRWTTDLHGIAQGLHGELNAYEGGEGGGGIYALNQGAGEGESLPVSQDVMAVLSMGQELHRLTKGRLNICLGALTSLWREARETESLPDAAALEEARGAQDISALVLDTSCGTALLTDPSVSLDVGGIAKGYALEKMRLYAQEQGITSLLVNLGGQVMAIGRHPDGDPWTVALRDPRDGSVLETLEVEDAVVVTSADDQRCFTVDGVTYHHILDPETGYPFMGCRSVTLILPLAYTTLSDGLSTALFLLSREEGMPLLREYEGRVIRVEKDGEVWRGE